MNSSPLVSVIIPVYNYERYISAAIESVIEQSFAHWELIIVDDNSSDTTPDIARSFANEQRITFIANEHNLGQFPTHNRGAGLAKGKYIKFLHGDDILYPHCLEIMVELMEEFPMAGLGISHSSPLWVAPKLLSQQDAWHLHLSGKSTFMSKGPSGTIFRADVFRAIGGFDPRYNSSDVKINLITAIHYPILLLPDGLFWYRHHNKQIFAYMNANDIGAKESIKWYPKLLDMPENPLPEFERQAEKERTIRQFLRLCLSHARRAQIRRAWHLYKASDFPLMTWLKLLKSTPSMSHFEIRNNTAPDCSLSHAKRGAQCSPPHAKIPAANRGGARKNMNPEQSTFSELSDAGKNLRSISYSPQITSVPVVSVLIPTSNSQLTIRDAIESVLAQRFTNWEIVIVDDSSTDNTYEIIQSYADGNLIRCFRNDKNIGKWKNYNRCARLARGRYLKYLNPDKILYPHCLSLAVPLMNNSGAIQGISVKICPSPAGTVFTPEEAWRHEIRNHPIFQDGVTASIYLTDAFHKCGGFDSSNSSPSRHLHLRLAAFGTTVRLPSSLYFPPFEHPLPIPEMYLNGPPHDLQWVIQILVDETCPLKEEEVQYVIEPLKLLEADKELSFKSNHLEAIRKKSFSHIRGTRFWEPKEIRFRAHGISDPIDLSLFRRSAV